MQKNKIIVPKGIRFIGDWVDYQLRDYGFPHILNKVLTGCGFTEYCIRNDQPLVLVSPRIFLLKNKADQHKNNLEVYRVVNEVEKSTNYEMDITKEKVIPDKSQFSDEEKLERINNLKSGIMEYVFRCTTSHVIPKILVTYDSFRYVKETLGEMINNFQIVVDEFQSIFMDARFKSSTEIELLYQLQGLQKVCLVSATPMLDKYLEMLDEFKDLPYYELDWKTEEPDRIIKPKLEIKFTTRSLNEEAWRVIQSYLEGRFETRLNLETGGLTESKEAVLFFNSVAGICQAIRSNNLHIDQVNILCAKSSENREKLRKAFNDVLRKETKDQKRHPRIPKEYNVIGEIPLEGEPHKMFTFCTRTVYLGADFYSTCARTFIFSDSNIECLSVDISMDLEQILGRQRLGENPWKNSAKMFVKTISKNHKIAKEVFDKRIEDKKRTSYNLLSSYNKCNNEEQGSLALNYQKVAKAYYYLDDYVAVNRHAGNSLIPVFNNLMLVSEMRAFEVQQIDYADRFTVFNAINEKTSEGVRKEVLEVVEAFNSIPNVVDKFKLMVEFSEKYEEEGLSKEDLEDFLNMIPPKFKDYYVEMGPDRIRANGYRETRLKKEWINQHKEEEVNEELINEILGYFKIGHRYSNQDAKAKLKDLYKKYNYEKTAKASDLGEYFCLKNVYDPSTKKHGVEILSRK